MKHAMAFAILFCTYYVSVAQRSIGSFAGKSILPGNSEVRDYIDTVKSAAFISQSDGGLGCATGIYAAPDSGYVTGNNYYGDLQKAQFFSLHQMGYTAPAFINDVQLIAALKKVSQVSDLIYLYVYDVDTGGFRPGNLLSISNPINLSDINDTGLGNTFTFITPVSVKDSFFISVVLPQGAGDTLVILSTVNECSSYKGWSWEQWSDGTWHTLANSWLADVDLAIFPIMDLPFNVGTGDVAIGKMAVSVFPNPAHNLATVEYFLDATATIQIALTDVHGRLVREVNGKMIHAGKHTEVLDLSGIPAGYYQLRLHDETKVIGHASLVIQ